MKRFLSILIFLALSLMTGWAQGAGADPVQIIAHRGYWQGNAQNSLASLAAAQAFGVWGSEFDVHLTADDAVVVHHDPTIDSLEIQRSPVAEIRRHSLANGEPVPLLGEYLAAAAPEVVMILEIKPQYSCERENELIDKCLEALANHALLEPGRVAFISFSYPVCQELARRCPGFMVQYLTGDKSPAELHADGIKGLDYNYATLLNHPSWVDEAHEWGLTVNVWTVDAPEVIREMLELGVDQITTNRPDLVRSILLER